MADEVLDRSIGILIPSKTASGEELSEEAIQGAIKFVHDAFFDIFSGLTDDGAHTVFQKSQLQGSYRARNGDRIDEPLVLIYAYYRSNNKVVIHSTRPGSTWS